MVFHITFMLALFHDKKCCNCINLFPSILWDLFVMSLVLSWSRLLKKLILQLGSRVVQPTKVIWGAHARSWRVNVFCNLSRDLANSWDDPRNALTVEILSVTLIPFTHTIYTLITHKIVRRLYKRKPKRGFYNTPTLLERATYPQ